MIRCVAMPSQFTASNWCFCRRIAACFLNIMHSGTSFTMPFNPFEFRPTTERSSRSSTVSLNLVMGYFTFHLFQVILSVYSCRTASPSETLIHFCVLSNAGLLVCGVVGVTSKLQHLHRAYWTVDVMLTLIIYWAFSQLFL